MASPVFALADSYVEEFIRLDPDAASGYGCDVAGDLTDYSPERAQDRSELDRRTLERLRRLDVTSDADRVARAHVCQRLEARTGLAELGEHLRPLHATWGPVQIVGARSTDRFQSADRRRGLVAQVPAALSSLRAALDTGAARGVVASRRQADIAAGSAKRYAEVFARASTGGDDVAGSASEAFAEIGRYLVADYPAAGPDGVGSERYRAWLEEYVGGTIDTDDTYAWGWEEVRRHHADLTAQCLGISGDTTPAAARKALVERDAGWIEGVDAYRGWLQDVQDEAIATLDGRLFHLPVLARQLQVVVAEGETGPPSCRPPNEDFTTPGRITFPVGTGTRFRPFSQLVVSYHEGVPGHHLQNSIAVDRSQILSRHQRVFYLNFHGEGWAHYAEQLMGDRGYLDHPEAQLTLLEARLARALRVVADLGLHLDLKIPADAPAHPGQRWSRATAVDVLAAYGLAPVSAANEVDRYLGLPSQAITYAIGQRAWKALALQARKNKIDPATFHTHALALGPLGPQNLNAEVGRMLETLASGPPTHGDKATELRWLSSPTSHEPLVEGSVRPADHSDA